MKYSTLAAMAVAFPLASGCANVERSRDLANPNVSAATLAQQVCSNCHGVTGNAISPNFPNLAGQVDTYVIAQLTSFRSHDRRDPAGFEYMWGISRSLTDDQIKGLAAYFASQTPVRQPIEGTPSQIDAGKAIFENGVSAKNAPACSSCHGAQGQGNGAFPRIAGQHADYIVKQLDVFQRSVARPDATTMMKVAHDLSRKEIEDVASYLQAMPNR